MNNEAKSRKIGLLAGRISRLEDTLQIVIGQTKVARI
jgi:hypothetical protein